MVKQQSSYLKLSHNIVSMLLLKVALWLHGLMALWFYGLTCINKFDNWLVEPDPFFAGCKGYGYTRLVPISGHYVEGT